MEITIFNKNLTVEEETVFSDYVNKKVPAIKNLLKHYPEDAYNLKASIEKFDKHDAYEVEFSLNLSPCTYVAKEASHMITKAVDLAKDRFVAQIRKHNEIRRNERNHKTIRQNKEKAVEIVNVEETVI